MKPKKYSSERTKEIFKNFGSHISDGQIRFLSAGHLDVLEGERKSAKFMDNKSGKGFIDGFSSAGSFNIGRRNTAVVESLCKASETYDMGTALLLSKPKIEFAKELVASAPGDLNKVVFTGSGADSIEAAIKLAKGATGREEIISMDKAYHGHSGFSLSAGGKDYYKELFQPLMPGFKQVEFGRIEAVKQVASNKTAAILIEPVQGEGGIHVSDDQYLIDLRTLCDELGIILIFDEIQTGFGRTGKLWFSDYSGVVPDIMALAKSIGGGVFPNGAIVYRETEQLAGFVNNNPFFHKSSGGGSNPGCEVSRKVLQEISEKELWENAETMGDRLRTGLRELMAKNSKSIKEIRGRGLMTGIEYKHEFMGVLMADCLAKSGIFAVYSGNAPQVMRFMLPLTVTKEEIDEFLKKFRKAIALQNFYIFFLLPLTKVPLFRKWLNEDDILIPINLFLRKFGV